VSRRGGAWFIDAVLCGLAGSVPALLLADAYELNRAEDGFDVERHGSEIAFFLRDTVVILRRSELAITAGSFLVAVLLLLVVLPGRWGWSPGHLAADLRIVRRDGHRIGIGRAAVRSLAWVVDLLPGLPLVAYVVARATRRHQRVGDLLARTYVVDKRAAGRPVDERLDEDHEPVVVTEPLDEREPLDEDDAVPDDEPASPSDAGPPEGVPRDEPIWDRRNRRYVLWHSKSGRWLTHTDSGWAPFEQAPPGDARPEEAAGRQDG